MKLDPLIYLAHLAFWGAFGAANVILRSRGRAYQETPPPETVAKETVTAHFSRAVVAVHFIAFGAMYLGLGQVVVPGRVPEWFPGQRLVGAVVIAAGSALMIWARVHFHSWRFRAKLGVGHALVTSGPFQYLRHPIYMGMNLLALGTAIWVPTPMVWIAVGLMAAGGDVRARAEETVLRQAFGQTYRDYSTRVRRFVPGVY